MKPEKKNGKIAKFTTHNKEYKIVTNSSICEPYWDYGIVFYPKNRRGL